MNQYFCLCIDDMASLVKKVLLPKVFNDFIQNFAGYLKVWWVIKYNINMVKFRIYYLKRKANYLFSTQSIDL